MAKHSLYDQKTDLTKLSVKIDGSAVSDKTQIAGVSVYKSLYKISTAKIELFDGNISDAEFETIEKESYEPGKEIEISLGYHDKEDVVFKGVIVKHNVKVTSSKAPKIIIECADKAIELTGQRKFDYHKNMKDSDIISKICRGISKEVEGTDKTHETIVQHNVSDWDFIITRAQANGLVVANDEGKILVKKPKAGSSVADLTYGENIIDTDLTVDARSQIKELKAYAWDPKVQKVAEGTGEEPTELEKVGKALKGKKIAGDINFSESEIRSTGNMDADELKSWASSTLMLSRFSRLQGIVKTQGIKVNPMDTVDIKSLGKYYDGEAYVSGVYHEQKDGNWVTEIEIGLKPDLFVTQKTDISLPNADGLFPGINGLFIGKVKKIDADPEGQFRVLLTFPMIKGEKGDGVWARVSNIMASNGFGSWFMPEVDDEVICGALGGDMRFPIILGHLYSDNKFKHHNEFVYNDENNFKGWVTREKLVLRYDDKDKIIRIETPGGQKFKLDDKDKSITLEDQHKNKMLMNSSGFEFTGNKDFVVNVKGKIDAKAIGNIAFKTNMGNFDASSKSSTIKGTMSATLDGMKADVKGSMSAGVTSSGMAKLKGSIVMIN